MTAAKMIEDMLNDYATFNYDEQKNSTLKELGLDSLDRMELFYFLRDKLDINAEIQDNATVEDIVNFIEAHAESKLYGTV